jgi:hypothetical protein
MPVTPAPHAETHEKGGVDPLFPQDLSSGSATVGEMLLADGDGGWTTGIPAGSGEVVGPAGATPAAIGVAADGTGDLLADGGASIASLQGPRTPIAYTHTQAAPATEWVINHNLGYNPLIEVFTSGGARVKFIDITHFSVNQARVNSISPFAGTARCL